MPPKKKIRYDDSYLKFGFSVIKAYGEGVPRKISEKKYLGTSNFADFAREISKIRSKDGFYLETTNFGKKIDKREREFS